MTPTPEQQRPLAFVASLPKAFRAVDDPAGAEAIESVLDQLERAQARERELRRAIQRFRIARSMTLSVDSRAKAENALYEALAAQSEGSET